MVVEGSKADVGRVGDLLDARLLSPAFGDQPDGGVDQACLVRAFRRSSRLAGTASFSDAALTVLPLWSRPASLLLLGALTVHRRAGDSLPDAAPALAALGVSLAYLAAALTR